MFNRYPGTFPVGKGATSGTYHLPRSSSEVKKETSYTSPFPPPPPMSSWRVYGQCYLLRSWMSVVGLQKDRPCIYKCDIEERSRDHCCHSKEKSFTSSECVSVALVIQHVKRMRYSILPSVACPTLPYCSTLPHKRHDCKGKYSRTSIIRTSIIRNVKYPNPHFLRSTFKQQKISDYFTQ